MTFVDWLLGKLEEKQMSMNQVAQRSNGGVSHATISRILSGKQKPTCDICLAIADGLGEPRYLVLAQAGILVLPPSAMPLTAQETEWLGMFKKLSDESRADILDIARMKVVREKRAKYTTDKGGAR